MLGRGRRQHVPLRRRLRRRGGAPAGRAGPARRRRARRHRHPRDAPRLPAPRRLRRARPRRRGRPRQRPGTLYVLEHDLDAPRARAAFDPHGMDPAAVLAQLDGLAAAMGIARPVGRVLVVGCEPASLDEGMGCRRRRRGGGPAVDTVTELVATTTGRGRMKTVLLALVAAVVVALAAVKSRGEMGRYRAQPDVARCASASPVRSSSALRARGPGRRRRRGRQAEINIGLLERGSSPATGCWCTSGSPFPRWTKRGRAALQFLESIGQPTRRDGRLARLEVHRREELRTCVSLTSFATRDARALAAEIAPLCEPGRHTISWRCAAGTPTPSTSMAWRITCRNHLVHGPGCRYACSRWAA